MFTGIVQVVGTLVSMNSNNGYYSMSITAPDNFLINTNIGDSICVQGVCLTATDVSHKFFNVDVSTETLQCTALADKEINNRLNLELALTLSTALGGHLVTGHVDGVGYVKDITKEGESTQITVNAPDDIAKFIAHKGSICIDGVSFTVNDVNASAFSINVIPHTLKNTTINEYRIDSKVNLEVDLIARYLDRLQSYTN